MRNRLEDIYKHVPNKGYIQNLQRSSFFFFWFLGLHLWHVEVSRLGVELALQLPAYTTTKAMQNPSHVCNLHPSAWQRQILNPLNEARDQTHILMDPSRVRYH